MAVEQNLMTLEEFDQLIASEPDRLYELINGSLVEKVPTEEHAEIAGIVAGEVYAYLKAHPQLKARFGVEGRFRPADDHLNDRLPDVFLRFTDDPPVRRGPVIGVPDIAVEIRSPDDSIRSMREKADFYLANGSQMVWLIYPEQRLVEVYQPKLDILILQPGDRIDGGIVLPDFFLAVSTLFSTAD
ncbi:MAG: Uma2 family endonuclease [Chloroflexi bacterium]|nr:Uma2 family endonuclease [Chloroflexota bacterium]